MCNAAPEWAAVVGEDRSGGWSAERRECALCARRVGQITLAQRIRLLIHVGWLLFAAVALACFVAAAAGLTPGVEIVGMNAWALLAAGVAAATLVFLTRNHLLDIINGRVVIVEGVATKSVSSSGRTGQPICYYHIGDLRLTASDKSYHALVAGRRYRVYYAPRSKTLLNIEPSVAPKG